MNLEFKKIRIHTLTPLFIGDGTEYSRLDFWLDTLKQELVEFTPQALMEKLTEQEKASLGNKTLSQLAKMIGEKRPEGIRKNVCIGILKKHIAEEKSDKYDKEFLIKKHVRDTLTQKPYIPGSSLKGVLRTGYLAALWRDRTNAPVSQDIIGKFRTDAFSAFKLSDFICSSEGKSSYIILAKRERKPNTDDRYDLPASSMAEVVKPGVCFEGDLRLDKHIKERTQEKISSITDVLEKTEKYSLSLLNNDNISIGQHSPLKASINNIKQAFKNRTYLVRLGGFIGAESHTVQKRKIKIINPRDRHDIQTRDYSTTYAVATYDDNNDSAYTFGWCLIEVMDDDSAVIPQKLKEYTDKINKSVMPLYNKGDLERIYASVQPVVNINSKPKQAECAFTNVPKIIRNREPLDRNATYEGQVIKFSKKGKPIVDVKGKELTVTNCGAEVKVGGTIKIGKIQGTTCQKV